MRINHQTSPCTDIDRAIKPIEEIEAEAKEPPEKIHICDPFFFLIKWAHGRPEIVSTTYRSLKEARGALYAEKDSVGIYEVAMTLAEPPTTE